MSRIGDCFRMRKWRHEGFDKGAYVELKVADKNKVAVFMFLGYEDKDGKDQMVDPDEVLKSMGWTPPKDAVKVEV